MKLKTKNFVYRDKVKYSDCDMHQHLNHARYFSFFEQARVEYFENLGMRIGHDYKSIPFIIAAAHCDYLAPVYLNDEIEIVLQTTSIGNTSFRFDYEMKNAKTGVILAKGYTVQVMFDYEKMKKILVPEDLKKKMASCGRGNFF